MKTRTFPLICIHYQKLKDFKDSSAEVCGAGVRVIKSKPIDNKLDKFFAPI